jgi:hypothetical protein
MIDKRHRTDATFSYRAQLRLAIERSGIDLVIDAGEEVIRIRGLDQLLEEIVPDIGNRRVFLKMDHQGYDLWVFKGLGNRLERVIGLQSEVSLISIYEGMPNWTDSISLYEQAGFGVVGTFPVNRDSGRVIEYDCLLERVAA